MIPIRGLRAPVAQEAAQRRGRCSTWTADREAELRRLWLDGLYPSAIAEALGVVSRNAVIGKAYRMGLPGRTAMIESTGTVEGLRDFQGENAAGVQSGAAMEGD